MLSAHLRRELQKLYHPHFLTNYIMVTLYFITKVTSPVCDHLYSTCSIDFNEYQLLIFLASMVTLRSKRYISIVNYLSHFCMLAKFANLFMFFQQNVVYSVFYGLLWLLQMTFITMPVYKGEDKVVYFNDSSLKDEIDKRDSKTVWIVTLYTAWSPMCINLAPVFAELSQFYGNDRLRFGKIDVSRNPETASKYRIDCSNWSRNLPTIICFRSGREVARRPLINMVGKVTQKFVFTWESIVQAFQLNDLFGDVKVQNDQNAIEIDEKKEN